MKAPFLLLYYYHNDYEKSDEGTPLKAWIVVRHLTHYVCNDRNSHVFS